MGAALITIPHWGYRPILSPFRFPRGMGAVTVSWSQPLQTIADTIIRQENANPSYNNPGNLMYAGQPGASSGPGGLAVFDTYANGLQALYAQITLDANRGLTISDFTAKYAPATIAGNDPVLYANNIAGALGTSPDARLSDILTSSNTAGLPDLSFAGAAPGSFDPTALVDSFQGVFQGVDPLVLAGGAVLASVILFGVFRR